MSERRRSKSWKQKRPHPSGATERMDAPEDARYGIAMLKVAMELKKSKGLSLDEVVSKVVSQMGLQESDFRSHLASRGRLVRNALRKRNS